jgi:hypothetical protein
MVLSFSERVGFSVREIFIPNISSADPCGIILNYITAKILSNVSPPTCI